MDLTDAGIRMPWIAHWPKGIAAGSVTAQHCLALDWSATMLELGGGTPPADHPVDGVSLVRVLADKAATFARPMRWRMKQRQQPAYHDGVWKYLKVDDHQYLFDIRADARKCANLAYREPTRLAAMR